jgi:hypothetical protein
MSNDSINSVAIEIERTTPCLTLDGQGLKTLIEAAMTDNAGCL